MNKHSAYYRTINGQLSQMYYGQKIRSKKNGYPPPDYTKDELREWLLSQTIYWDIYVTWIDSDYKSDLKPSIDRLDDYKGYSFSNIRITTWGINDQKGRDDRRNGINNKQSQPIHQFSKSGEYIKTYNSTMDATRQTGVLAGNIWNSCNGNQKSAGNYLWSYNQSK